MDELDNETGLILKYFVLKPESNHRDDVYAKASREAMKAYAIVILPYNKQLAHDLKTWVEEEERNNRESVELPF